MANNQIKIGVGFQVDKSGLSELQNSLRQIQNSALIADPTGKLKTGLNESAQAADKLENILNKSWNSKLNQLDLSKVVQGIKETYGSVSKMKAELEKSGPVGSNAYNHIASAILNTNLQLKQSNKLLDEMATSMANTIKWGITSSIFNNITNSISQAYNYTKKLDSSLNDIRIVTDKSAESMEKFARQANNAAKGLGASTLDYTEASLIYYQQGLGEEDVAARAETTLKAANVTGQYADEVSEQLTAVWNGYKVSAQEAELYVDKLAAVASTTAADLEELSTGMSKVASAANSMGVDVDQLNAQLATIVSVTRQAPESVGTALKTIYARMSDLKVGGTDEDGLGLGDVSGTMSSMGIQVLDASGNLREMGDVIEEVASKWGTWTEAQKTAMAQVMAGKRQYNNLVALFENWDMYTDALTESTNAAGTLQKQQDIYMESTEAHLQQLRTEAEKTYDILFDQNIINRFTDALTGTLNLFNSFIDSFGGGANSIIALGGIIANIFHKQIGKAVSQQIDNIQLLKNNADAEKLKEKIIIENQAKGNNVSSNTVLDTQVQNTQKILSVQQQISQEKANELIKLQEQIAIDQQRLEEINKYKQIAKDLLNIEDAQSMLYNGLSETFEEAINKKIEEIELNKTALDIYREATEEIGSAFNTTEEALKTQESLLRIINESTEEERKNVDIEKLSLKILGEIELTEEEIEFLQKSQNRLNKEKENQLQRLQEGIESVAQAESDVRQELEDQVEARQRLLDEEVSIAEQRGAIERTIQGFTSLTSIIITTTASLSSLVDSSLTTEERFKQFGTTLLATGGLLISNFDSIKGLKKSIPGALLSISNALNGTSIESVKAAGGIGQLVTSILGAKVSILGLSVGLAPLAAIIAGVTVAIWAAVKAYNAKRDKMIEEQKLLKETQEAYQKTKEEYDNLKSSLEDYSGARKSIDELKEGTIEWTEKVQELNQKILELMSLYPELAQYVTNEDGILTISNEGIDALKEQYLKKTQSAIQAQYNQTLEANQAEREYKIQKTTREIGSQITYDSVDIVKQQTTNASESSNYNAAIETKTYTFGQIEKLLNDMANKGLSITDSMDTLLAGINYKDYGLAGGNEQLEKILSALRNNYGKEISSLENTLKTSQMKQQILEEQKGLGLLQQTGLFEDVDNNTLKAIYKMRKDEIVVNEEEIQAAKTSLGNDANKYAEAAGLSGSSFAIEDGKVVAKDEEGNVTGERLLEDVEKQVAELTKATSVFVNTAIDDIKTITNLQSEADNVYQGLGNYMSTFMGGSVGNFAGATGAELQDIQKALNNFDWGQFSAYGFKSAEAFKNRVEQDLQQAIDNVDGIALAKSMIDSAAITSEIQGVISKSSYTDLDEKQLAHLEQLEAKYQELGAIQDKNSHEYLQMLRQIQEIEEDNAKKELELQRDKDLNRAEELEKSIQNRQIQRKNTTNEEEIKKIDLALEADVTEFESIMDKLQENYGEMKVLIDADLKTDVEEAFGLADEFGKLRELIPEDLTVTFEEAQKLIADGYAGILENAKETSENSIKLDKETMNAFIDNRQAELEADRQSKIAQLENQRTILVTQRDALKKKLEALEKAKNAETAVEAAAAMSEVQNANKEYEAATKLLNAELDTEDKTAEQKEKIDEQLFNNLKGMYVTDSENQQNAEIATTNVQKQEIDTRIDNVKKLYNAYKATRSLTLGLFDPIAKIEPFPEDTGTSGGGTTQTATTTDVSAKGVEYEELTTENFNQYIEDLFTNNKESYLATIEEIFNTTKEELEAIDAQIGAHDSGIAALKAAGISLDRAQSKAGSKEGSKNKKEEKKKEDEIDRYWELNKAIENVEEAISDLDKQQEKLYGREKINSLREENKLLAKQADAYRALAEEQRKEAGELQGLLSTYGVVFDAQGGIANYLAASQAMLDQYNQAVAAYNAGLIDEATFGITERAYDNFKSTIDRYEELYYNEMRETQNKLDDIHRQELENNLEAWEIEIQIKLDMKELKRQWNDFFKEINENFKLVYADLDATMANLVENSKTYVGDDGDINTIRKAVSDVTKEIDKMRSGGESDKFESISQAQEKLKELNEQLMDSATAMRELWQEAWDTYLEGIDQAADKFSDLMDKYDGINEQIEYQRELIELLYGDEAYSLMGEYYDAQLNNTNAQIGSLKQQAEMWKEQYETAKAIDDTNGTMSEDTLKFYELWQEAQKGLNDKVKEYIELLQKDYSNTVNEIIDNLEKKLTGGMNFDLVQEQWDLLQQQADGYYDDVEKIYQLSTLENKYQKSISNATGKHQKQLQNMYEKEMKYLQEKKNLSEYDIDIANAKYEMTLKQIALEEARQNKNSMTLVRGADGNWAYQYVSNAEEVEQKEQELLDTTNNYYQIAKDGFENYNTELMSLTQDYLTRLAELENQRTLGTISEEEYNQGLANLDILKETIESKSAEFGDFQHNLTDATLVSTLNAYEANLDSYEWMTTQQKELLDGLKNGTISSYDEMLLKAQNICQSTLSSWNSAAAGIAETWYNNPTSVKQEILNAYNLIQEANNEYKQAISDLEESAGQDFGEEGIKGAIDDAKKATNQLENETKKLVQTAESELPKYREQVSLIEQAWYGVKDGIESSIATIEEYLKYVGETKTAVDEMAISMQKAAEAQEALNAAKAAEPPGSGKNPLSLSESGYAYTQTGVHHGSGNETWPLYSVRKPDGTLETGYIGVEISKIMKHPQWGTMTKYNTGGYTGEWNNGDTDGRLAWLHQKELVLNSADTANILSVVDTVRDMTNIGSSIESSIMNNISKMVMNLMNLGNYGQSYQPQLVTTEGATENIFNINAEFPNANDVSSIREAILNLPNMASQYIARNKR